MKPQQPTSSVMNLESLLNMITVQAHSKAYETAVAIVSQVVTALTKSGKVGSVEEAAISFEKGLELFKVKLEKDLIALSLNEAEASLPKNEKA